MRYIITAFAIFGLNLCALADQQLSAPPKQASTVDEITKVFGERSGFGPVQTAQFRRDGRQVFAVWYCPFSGRSACYLRVYYYDYDKSQWTLFIDRLIEGTHDLSAEMPFENQVVVFRGTNGKVAVQESVEKLPSKKWWDEKK